MSAGSSATRSTETTTSTRRSCSEARCADGDHRRPRHAPRRPGAHRSRGLVPRGSQQAPTGRMSSRASRRARAGEDVDGVPVFDTVAEAVAERGANTALVFVPARFAADAIYEAVDAGIGTVICVTEGVPAHDMLARLRVLQAARGDDDRAELPRRALAGQGERRDHPGRDLLRGLASASSPARGRSPIRSATSSTQLGLGNSTIVGIGGDPVVGSSFIDVLRRFEADDETEIVVLVGEIGGDEEEKAARFVEAEMTKPVVSLHRGLHRSAGQDDGARRARSSPAPPERPRERRPCSRAAASASERRRPRRRSWSPRSPLRSPSAGWQSPDDLALARSAGSGAARDVGAGRLR